MTNTTRPQDGLQEHVDAVVGGRAFIPLTTYGEDILGKTAAAVRQSYKRGTLTVRTTKFGPNTSPRMVVAADIYTSLGLVPPMPVRAESVRAPVAEIYADGSMALLAS